MNGARCLGGMLLCLLCSTAAFADDRAEAQRHYDAGIAHYKLGEFAEAIVAFKAAYSIAPTPSLLFDLAQSYRQLGDPQRSLFFYRSFVANAPPSPAREDARAIIEELRAQLDSAHPPAAPPPVSLPRTPPADREAVHPIATRPSREQALALVASTGAGGLAFLGTAIGLSVYAHATSNGLEQPSAGATWSKADAARYSSGRAATDASVALYVVGTSALAASVISAIVCRHALAAERATRLTAAAGGISWAF